MKVLISSLLRIGDFLMHQNVRNGIKQKFPNAEITWILQDGTPSIAELLPAGDHHVFFPRKTLQELAKLKTLPIGAPEMVLSSWLAHFDDVKFDWALNLGHDKTSAYVLSKIEATKKTGLQWDGRGWQAFNNSWLSYLNDHMGSGVKSEFHYCDVLLQMADLKVEMPKAQINNSNLILIQPFTSDKKKNWNIENWARLQNWISKNTPYKCVAVGAFFEETELRKAFKPEDIWLGGLGELQALVRTARAVIAGDTGIIHMAALESIPSITLSLGSSDPVKTSAFGTGHWVLSPQTNCRPCNHKVNCTKVSHLCGEDLHPEYVENFLDYLINPTGPIKWKQDLNIAAFETVREDGVQKLRNFKSNVSGQDAPEKEGSHERRSSSLL